MTGEQESGSDLAAPDAIAPTTLEPPRARGWYPDPFERLRFRWWNGTEWTAYAGDDQVRWDPDPLKSAEPPSPGLPGSGVAVLGAVVGMGLALAAHFVLRSMDRPGGRTFELAVGELFLWAGLLSACFYVSRRRGTGSFASDFGFRFRPIDLGIGFAGSLVGRVVAGIAISPVPMPYRHLRDIDRSLANGATHGAAAWVVIVIVVCVGAPLVEELFFRGLLQTRLVGRWGAVPGVAVTSVIFGAAHLVAWQGPVTFAYALAIAASGAVLGMIRLYSGRLGPSIVAHVLFNAQAILAIALLR